MRLSQLAFRTQGLFERPEEDRAPVLSINEPSPVMFRGRFDQRTRSFVPEQALVFRVAGVQPSGPPASLDVVRDQVIKDWKLNEAYKLAGQQAEKLAVNARQVGLRQAVADATDLKTMLGEPPADPATTQPAELDPVVKMNIGNLGPNEPMRFTRLSQSVRGVGFAPTLAEKVFALGDPTTLDAAQRILATGLTRSQAWVVVEFTGLKPLYAGEFEKQRQNLAQGLGGDRYRALAEWFKPENIRLRSGWQPKRGRPLALAQVDSRRRRPASDDRRRLTSHPANIARTMAVGYRGSSKLRRLDTMSTRHANNAMNDTYEFNDIEPKWQKAWEERAAYRAANPGQPGSERPKFYVLDFFPYPSGAGLHVGHPLGYIASDIIARFMRMRGHNVLHPMGWDAFGLPAEQYAVETGVHPRITTAKNIETYKRQLRMIGLSLRLAAAKSPRAMNETTTTGRSGSSSRSSTRGTTPSGAGPTPPAAGRRCRAPHRRPADSAGRRRPGRAAPSTNIATSIGWRFWTKCR